MLGRIDTSQVREEKKLEGGRSHMLPKQTKATTRVNPYSNLATSATGGFEVSVIRHMDVDWTYSSSAHSGPDGNQYRSKVAYLDYPRKKI
jgi:hypothetical protein